MRKFLTAAIAAATVAGSVAGVAAPATAQEHHVGWHGGGVWHGGGGGWHGGGWRGGGYGYHGWHGGGYGWGVPLAAGVAGLALGAALADSYAPAYPAYGYYGYPGYAYPAYGYGECGHWQWDPYYRRNVWVGYAC